MKKERGITLIALIITIIILLILAMVTIRILMNQGIIKHAQNATEAYNDAQNNETEYLTYAEGEMDKYAGGSDASDNGGWTDNGDGTFTKGDMTLKVGDYVAYDATKDDDGADVATQSYTSYALANADSSKNNGRTNGYTIDYTFNVNNYTSGWRVLGVTDGKLQLISASSVSFIRLKGQEGYRDSEEELNAICAIYGQGKGAVAGSARSIKIEDINAITGYDPSKTGDGNPYGNGTIYQYGNDVTYSWQGTNYPYYSATNGKARSLDNNHSSKGFNWWDGSAWQSSPKSTTATASAMERITTLKNTSYDYYPYSLTHSGGNERKGLATDSNEYKVLFDESNYWTASRCVGCDERNGASFQVRYFSGRPCRQRLLQRLVLLLW